MVPTTFDHTIYEVEGDLKELSTVKNTELLDKKIVKRSTEVTIDLSDKSLKDKLSTYLTTVLELPEKTVLAAMEIFNANHKGS